MRTRSRRRLDVVLIGTGGLILAGTTAIAAYGYNEERYDAMWMGASIRPDGTAAIHEVIDDNFGNAIGRHGLLRTLEDVTPSVAIAVQSPTGAPDQVSSIGPSTLVPSGVDVYIGEPSRTVSGRHRYVLDYELTTLVRGEEIAWDAIGAHWQLPIEQVEVHLVAPWALTDLRCVQGPVDSDDECEDELVQVEPGHLVLRVDETVEEDTGIRIDARRGAALAATPALPPDPPLPKDGGAGIAQPTAVALVAAVGGGLSMSRWVRRAGRERVGAGGATDAAFADASGSTSERLVDSTELAGLATTDFAPPEGLTAPMGGIVLREAVQPEHKVAWLLEQAIAGTVELDEDGKHARLTRLAPGQADAQGILDSAFGGRESVTLGSYDKTFAEGWGELGTHLDTWSDASEMWDPQGDRRRTVVRVLGGLACILATIVAVVAGAFAGRFGDDGWFGLLAVGAIAAGAGWAAAIRGWELRVRTPKGSATWLRVESFRRFLHDSEAFHAEEAAKRGVLREYTAWAVALGEIDRWTRAVEASTVIPDTAGLHYVALAPMLSSSTTSASTAPSSSGGGGGGGGGVGGGGGGGGGGNW